MIAAVASYVLVAVLALLLQAGTGNGTGTGTGTGGTDVPQVNDFVRIATTYYHLYVVPFIVWLVRRISLYSQTKKHGYIWAFVLAIPTTFFNTDTGLFSMEKLMAFLGTGLSAMGLYHFWKNYKAAKGKPLP